MDIMDIRLPIPTQIHYLSHFSLTNLNNTQVQIPESQELVLPFTVEKIVLGNLERKLVMVLDFMAPGQSMTDALLQNPNRSHLVASLVERLTIPGRPFNWDVFYEAWFQEDIVDLLARVRRAAAPASIVRRRVFAVGRPIIKKMVRLMDPEETILHALRRMYVTNKNDPRLSHLWAAYLLEVSGPFLRTDLIHCSWWEMNARLLEIEASVPPMFLDTWKKLESRLGRIRSMVESMLPGETVTQACARLPLVQSNSLFLNAQRIRHELTTDARPFHYRVRYTTWTREDVEGEIPGVEKEMLTEAVFKDIYA